MAYTGWLTEPATDAKAVTPNDGADLSSGPSRKGLIIGTAGDIKITTLNGTTLVIPVPVGYMPINASRVWSTSTTAAGITALY